MATPSPLSVEYFGFDAGCARSPTHASSVGATWVGQWDTAVWTPVNAWPFCTVCLMVRGSTSTFTTWRFSYEETRGRHPHTLRDERKSALYPSCPLSSCPKEARHRGTLVRRMWVSLQLARWRLSCCALLPRRHSGRPKQQQFTWCWKECATQPSHLQLRLHKEKVQLTICLELYPVWCGAFLLGRAVGAKQTV